MNIRKPKSEWKSLATQSDGEDDMVRVTITAGAILKTIGILVAIFFLWFIRDVIGLLFVAIVLASAMDPWVDRMERYHIPRGMSILTMYLSILLALGLVFYLIIPPLIEQIGDITQSLSQYNDQIDAIYQWITNSNESSLANQAQAVLAEFNQAVSGVTTGVFDALAGVFGGIAGFIIVLVLTFYMTIEEDGIKKFIRSIAPVQYQPYLIQKVNKIQLKMGGWFRGQFIVSLIIGVISFIGLMVIGVEYALVLALIAGMLEFIPFIGPFIAAVPAVFFAYTDSPWKALAVVIFYTVMQQLENQLIVPRVMQKVVGLNPIVVIAAMLIGAKMAGIVGIILAIPVTTIIWIFLEDFFLQKREMDNALE